MTTTPRLLSREVLDSRTFEVREISFVTPRGSHGLRTIYRIDRKTVSRNVWAEARAGASAADAVSKQGTQA